MFLNETYYGKNPELEKCETYIKAMKEYLISGKNPNKCPEKTLLERTIADLFGFEGVYYSIIAQEDYDNGMTVPYFVEANYSADDHFFDLVKTSNGIKYKNPKGKFLYVYTFNYSIRNGSVETIMSILLHEIGHNFFLVKEQIQDAKMNYGVRMVLFALQYLKRANFDPRVFPEVVAFLLTLTKDMKSIQMSVFKEYQKFLTDKTQDRVIKNYEKKRTGLNKIINDSFFVLGKIFGTVVNLPFTLINVMLLPLYLASAKSSGKVRLQRASKDHQGYNAEKFCDNFAASYGYGAGVAMVFETSYKYGSYKNQVSSKIPVVRIIDYFNQSLYMFANYFHDPHPDNQRRVIFMLNKLEYELNANKKDLNPKQVAEIEEQIAQIKDVMNHAPMYKRIIDGMFAGISKFRDDAGSVGYTDNQIYDFEEHIFGSKVSKNESVNFDSIFNEGITDFFDTYIN